MSLKLPRLRCLRCRHDWFPRKETLPKVCPNLLCKSPYWNVPRKSDQV